MSSARAHRDRAAPGASITGRLMGRAHTRARVGPAPSFYHKFGVPDPIGMEGDSLAGPGEPPSEGPFTFLSSAAYLRSIRQARFRLLGRISSARHVGRVGERLTAGPAFAVPQLGMPELGVPLLAAEELALPGQPGTQPSRAPSTTLSMDKLTTLVEPPSNETPTEAQQGSGTRRARGEGRSRSRLRERTTSSRQTETLPGGPAARLPRQLARTENVQSAPAARAAARVRPVARAVTRAREGELARASSAERGAMPEVQPLLDALSALSRATRRQVGPLIQKVLDNPTPATLASTRKVLQAIRTRPGTDSAAMRGELGPIERSRTDWTSAEAGERVARKEPRSAPGARKLGRNSASGRGRGLAPVLSSSPSWVLVEAAERELPNEPAPERKGRETSRAARTRTVSTRTAPTRTATQAVATRAASEQTSSQVAHSRAASVRSGSSRTERVEIPELGRRSGSRPVPTARLAARSQLRPRLDSSRGHAELERGLAVLEVPELERLLTASEAPASIRTRRTASSQAPVRRAAARWAVGRVEESEAAPLSSSATGWMSRQPSQRPARLPAEPALLAPTPQAAEKEPATGSRPASRERTVSRTTRTSAYKPAAPKPTGPKPTGPKPTGPKPTARAAARLLAPQGASPTAHVRKARTVRAAPVVASETRAAPAPRAQTARRRAPEARTVPGVPETQAIETQATRTPRRRPAVRATEAPVREPLDLVEAPEPVEAPELDLMEQSPVTAEPRARRRLLARAEPTPRTDSRGVALLSEAPVARTVEAGPRRLAAADEVTWLQPEATESSTATAAAPGRTPRRTRQARPEGTRTERPTSAPETTSPEVAAKPARKSGLAERVTARESQGREPEVDSPAERVTRTSRTDRPAIVPTLLAPEPVAPGAVVPGAVEPATSTTSARPRRAARVASTVRASRRDLAGEPRSSSPRAQARPRPGRRVAVAVSPTSYVEEPAASAVALERRPASRAARAMPTARTSERAELTVRLDQRGRVMLTPRVISELRDAVLAIAAEEPAEPLARSAEPQTRARRARPRLSRADIVRHLPALAVSQEIVPSQSLGAAMRGRQERAQTAPGLAPRSVPTFDLSFLQDLVAPAQTALPTQSRQAGPRQTVRASARLDAPPVQLDASRWAMGVPLSSRPLRGPVNTVLATQATGAEAAPLPNAGQPNARPERTRTRAGATRTARTRTVGADRAERTATTERAGPQRLARTQSPAGSTPERGTLQAQRPRAERPDRYGPRGVLLAGAEPLEPGAGQTARSRRLSRAPAYARHAESVEETGSNASGPNKARTMAGASLLSALARSGDPEQVVQLVLERTSELSRAARALPDEAQTLIQRIVRGAHQAASQEQSSAPSRQGSAAQMLGQGGGPVRTITRRVASAPAAKSLRASPSATASPGNGVGASQAMKMAGKLMKLIHLAEAERRADAQRQMRMSEAGSTPEHTGPASPSSQVDSTAVEVLQHKVVKAVLDALKQQEMDEGLEGSDVWG